MEYTQAMVTPAAAQRDLMRLLPQLRDGVDTAIVRMQQAGDDPLAIQGVRTVLQRLCSGFRFLGRAELERFTEEVDAGLARLLDAWADPYANDQYCQDLHSGLLRVMLSWNDLLESFAEGDEPITEIAAAIDSIRCARGAPRYDSLALLRHCVDAQAPREWVEDADERASRARWPYQIGLLELLRGDEQRGLDALGNILEPLQRALGDSAAGSACWLVLGVLEALAGEGYLEVADKRALVAYDRELRRLSTGGDTQGLPAQSMVEVLLNRAGAAHATTSRVALLKHVVARFPRAELALPGAVADDRSGYQLLPAATTNDEASPELQELFYEEVGPAMAQLSTVLKRWRLGDVQAGLAIQRILHNLQRSSLLAGLQGFAEHCREIEQEVAAALADGFDQNSAERLRSNLESLAEEFDQLHHALRGRARLAPGESREDRGRGAQERACAEVVEPGVRLLEPQFPGVLEPLLARLLAVVEETAAEYQRSLDLEVVAVDRRMSAEVSGKVCAALEPLVVNALIHGVEPGSRRLQQGKAGRGTLRLRAWVESADLLITVSDDGQGLDLHGLQRQMSDYDPQEPADELSNDEALSLIALPGVSLLAGAEQSPLAGEGVGVACQVARELGGVLELETVPGSGATFTLRLPADLLETQPPDEVDESPEAARQRVLIVNDSRTLRRITAYLLGYMRFTMLEANSLAEAVMLARSHQPDGVVLDVQMGWGEAGLDALRRLEDEAGVAIPRIVAVTTREQDRQRLEQRGMHPAALLVEPYSGEDLVAALEEALQVGREDRSE